MVKAMTPPAIFNASTTVSAVPSGILSRRKLLISAFSSSCTSVPAEPSVSVSAKSDRDATAPSAGALSVDSSADWSEERKNSSSREATKFCMSMLPSSLATVERASDTALSISAFLSSVSTASANSSSPEARSFSNTSSAVPTATEATVSTVAFRHIRRR